MPGVVIVGIALIVTAVLVVGTMWLLERFRDHRAQVEWDRRNAEPEARPPEAVEPPIAVKWARSAGFPDDQLLDVEQRLEIVERLVMVGDDWCLETLREASREEREPRIRDAIAAALHGR